MAIAFRADGGYNAATISGTTTTLVLTVPTNVNGDLLIMMASTWNSLTAATFTTPSGWTLYTTLTSNNDDILGGFTTKLHIFYRYASSEPASYTIVCNGMTSVSGQAGTEGNIRSYSGTATSSPFNSNASTIVTAGSPSISTIPAFSESYVTGEMYVLVSLAQNSAGNNPYVTSYNFTIIDADAYENDGTWNSYDIVDYFAGGVPTSKTATWSITLTSNNDAIALAFTILPPSTTIALPASPHDIYFRRKDQNRYPGNVASLVEFPFAPAATPTKFSPNPVDYYKPLRRTEGFIAQGWQPVLTPGSWEPYNPDSPRYVPLRKTEGLFTTGWQTVLTPSSLYQNPVDYYKPLRRQSVDNIGTFVEFPGAPAIVPTWSEPYPNIPRYVPIRKTDGYINQGWQSVITPMTLERIPDELRYIPIRRQPVDNVGTFVEFPFAPAATSTRYQSNPDAPKYQPLRSTEGFYALGWQQPLTPGVLYQNPDYTTYQIVRRTEGLTVFTETSLAVSVTPSDYWPNPNDPKYQPLQKTEGPTGFVEFPFAPTATSIGKWPNPDDPRYVPIRKVDGSLLYAVGSGVVLNPTPTTLLVNPSIDYWALRRVAGSLLFVEYPFAPIKTSSIYFYGPDSPRYQPLRRTEGYNIQGWQPVLTPAVWQQWPDDPRYQPLRRTEGYNIQGWQPVLTPGSLFPNPDDPRYVLLRKTEGYNTQGWQPVLTPDARLVHPDDPRYIPLRKTEGYINQGWQPVLTPAVRLYNPNDPRYIQLRKTEGYIAQGQSSDVLFVGGYVANAYDTPYWSLRKPEGFTVQGWQPVLTPTVAQSWPDDPRYQPLRRTEGFTVQGWQPVLTPDVWQQWPDDPRYIALRRLSVDDIGFFVEFPFAPTSPLDIYLPDPDDPRYIPLRSTEGSELNILLPADLLPYAPILVQNADDPRYIPLRHTTAEYVRVPISFNGPPSRMRVSNNLVYRITTLVNKMGRKG